MDRSDPEVMAAERHQDRLDDDADAREAGQDVDRWRWAITNSDGLVLQDGTEDSPGEAYDALAEADGVGTDDHVEDWGSRVEYDRFWDALQEDVPDGGEIRMVDPVGTVYTITDTL